MQVLHYFGSSTRWNAQVNNQELARLGSQDITVFTVLHGELTSMYGNTSTVLQGFCKTL